jgi:hypothetical protein
MLQVGGVDQAIGSEAQVARVPGVLVALHGVRCRIGIAGGGHAFRGKHLRYERGALAQIVASDFLREQLPEFFGRSIGDEAGELS